VNPWVAQIFKVHSEDFFSDNDVAKFIWLVLSLDNLSMCVCVFVRVDSVHFIILFQEYHGSA
jgi:hypothetical protein